MTYKQFLEKIYWRKIKDTKYHLISNKGEVLNTKTGCILKQIKNVVTIQENFKTKGILVWKELLSAFPDIEFSNEEIRKVCSNHKIKRGAYYYPYNESKKWRSVIKFKGRYKFLGYFKQKKEALESFKKAFLILRGFRPW